MSRKEFNEAFKRAIHSFALKAAIATPHSPTHAVGWAAAGAARLAFAFAAIFFLFSWRKRAFLFTLTLSCCPMGADV
jgi:hypothetical protein